MKIYFLLSIGFLYFMQPAFGVATHPSLGDEWALEEARASRFNAVGRALTDYGTEGGEAPELEGTATLIAIPGRPDLNGRVALTARHVATSLFEESFFAWDLEGQTMTAKALQTHFLQEQTDPLADIALVLLDKAIPLDPQWLYHLPNSQNNRELEGDLALAGYGIFGRSDANLFAEDGRKRSIRGDYKKFKTYTQKMGGRWRDFFTYTHTMLPTVLTGLPTGGDSGALFGVQKQGGPIVAQWMAVEGLDSKRVVTDFGVIEMLRSKLDSHLKPDISDINARYKTISLSERRGDNRYIYPPSEEADEFLNKDIELPLGKFLGFTSMEFATPWILQCTTFM